MNNLNKELEKLFKKTYTETFIISQLDDLINEYGLLKVESWRNSLKQSKNPLLHELIDKQYYDVIRHLLSKYFHIKTSIKREIDGLTPFELAHRKENWKICDLFLEFNDEKTFTDTYEQFAMKKYREKTMNIVWLDLELTSLINPKILECAVIITDKDLNELDRSINYS